MEIKMKKELISILDTIQLKVDTLLDSIRTTLVDEIQEDVEDQIDTPDSCGCTSCGCDSVKEKEYGIEFMGQREYNCKITGTYDKDSLIFKEIMKAVKQEIFCEELEKILTKTRNSMTHLITIKMITKLTQDIQNDDNFVIYEV